MPGLHGMISPLPGTITSRASHEIQAQALGQCPHKGWMRAERRQERPLETLVPFKCQDV